MKLPDILVDSDFCNFVQSLCNRASTLEPIFASNKILSADISKLGSGTSVSDADTEQIAAAAPAATAASSVL